MKLNKNEKDMLIWIYKNSDYLSFGQYNDWVYKLVNKGFVVIKICLISQMEIICHRKRTLVYLPPLPYIVCLVNIVLILMIFYQWKKQI